MQTSISGFFDSLGLPRRNVRSSWGASNGQIVLLRSWADRYDPKTKQVVLLRHPREYLDGQGPGRSEREQQLRALWTGNAAGYVVLVSAKDPKAEPREIADFRRDIVWNIVALRSYPSGEVLGELGDIVPVAQLARHASTHRLEPAAQSPCF
jgi:hypothetical protein